MRVICIDDTKNGEPEAQFILKEGEVYEVVRTFQKGKPDWLWYELSIQLGVGYAIERFIPLSSVDEKTFERNYNVDWFYEIFIQPLKKS